MGHRSNFSRISFLFVLVLFPFSGQQLSAQSTFRLVELNVENLFDCHHDEGKEDNAFLPESGRRWTPKRYWKKLHLLSKTLASASTDHAPDLIALVEVENDTVMRDLTRRALLRKARYQYVMTQSGDPRGLDVALLYQPATFRLLSHRAFTPHEADGSPIATRDVLLCSGRLLTGDTLHVLLCHLSSRVGGRRAVRLRSAELQLVRSLVDSLQRNSTDAKVVITGDMNDFPHSRPLCDVLRAELVHENISPWRSQQLYNLSAMAGANSPVAGTYFYDGRWETLDQCIVTGNLMNSSASFHTDATGCHILAPAFLLDKDQFGRRFPRRTYEAYRYVSGLSDHLPLVVEFRYRWKE